MERNIKYKTKYQWNEQFVLWKDKQDWQILSQINRMTERREEERKGRKERGRKNEKI